MMVLWEYWVETINTEYDVDRADIKDSPQGSEIIQKKLQLLGDDGWELVTFLPALPAEHFRHGGPNPWVFQAVFKRPANEE